MRTAFVQFDRYDRRIFWTLAGLFMLSLAAYIYFLSVSIIAVVERRTAERETTRIGTAISQLESRYAEIGRGIDLSLAYELGFHDISVPTYVASPETKTTLSLRTNGESH